MRSALLLLLIVTVTLSADVRVNPDAQLVADFDARVADYMKLHRSAESHFPMHSTDSPSAIAKEQRAFAAEIRTARANAKQGDLFTPPIAAEFRRLISIAMQGPRAARVRKSLKSAEPVSMALDVDQAYPSSVPLQSTPASLLLNLPHLPKGLDYRIVGRRLVLRDVNANLVIDIIPDALPLS
jgi:hypothetical protein